MCKNVWFIHDLCKLMVDSVWGQGMQRMAGVLVHYDTRVEVSGMRRIRLESAQMQHSYIYIIIHCDRFLWFGVEVLCECGQTELNIHVECMEGCGTGPMVYETRAGGVCVKVDD